MIYIFTALYCEAHPMIQYFGLVRSNEIKHFQMFKSKEKGIVLTVTGVGSVAAATAVGSICMKFEAGAGDFLVNIGTCAGVFENEKQNAGEIFLCNKITELTTMRTFYPDVLYRHNFVETEIKTSASIIKKDASAGGIKEGLYDMEAGGIYQAGAYFFGPHQMSFLKVVSDAGAAETVTPQKVEECVGSHMEELAEYIENLQRIEEMQSQQNMTFNKEEEQWMEKVCEDMHCSVVMKNTFSQYVRYCRLAGIDYKKMVEELYEEQKLPCNSKREGKQYFEEFRKQIL